MTTRRVFFVLAVLAAFPAAALGANITLDEFGNAANDLGFIINSGTGQDVGPGGLANALLYSVPTLTWVTGDLFLNEPPQASGIESDLIRFNSNQIVFYSEHETTEPSPGPADIGFPIQFYTNTLTLTEVGPETGFNGLDYTPTAGQPGFVANMPGLTWHLQSDVPEPATMTLLALGGIGIAALRRRMK